MLFNNFKFFICLSMKFNELFYFFISTVEITLLKKLFKILLTLFKRFVFCLFFIYIDFFWDGLKLNLDNFTAKSILNKYIYLVFLFLRKVFFIIFPNNINFYFLFVATKLKMLNSFFKPFTSCNCHLCKSKIIRNKFSNMSSLFYIPQ